MAAFFWNGRIVPETAAFGAVLELIKSHNVHREGCHCRRKQSGPQNFLRAWLLPYLLFSLHISLRPFNGSIGAFKTSGTQTINFFCHCHLRNLDAFFLSP